jgi:hypothetical protein
MRAQLSQIAVLFLLKGMEMIRSLYSFLGGLMEQKKANYDRRN